MIAAEIIAEARAVPIEDEIARRSIKLRGKIERVGPCPVCGGRDRFAISTRKESWNCRGCNIGGSVVDLVMHIDGVGFIEAVEGLTGDALPERPVRPAPAHPPKDHGVEAYERRQANKAAWLWLQRCPIAGSPAETYLRDVRRYAGPLPATLGFLPPSKPEHHPAMIAAFGVPDEPEPGVAGDRAASPRYTSRC